jgi:outer membrane receptor protein involved in Fe transport
MRVNARLDSRSVEGGLTLHPGWASRIDLRAGHFRAEKGVPGGTQFPSPTATQWDETSSLEADVRGVSSGAPGAMVSGPKTVTSGSAFLRRRIRRYADPGYPLGPVDESHRNDSAGFEVTQARDLGGLGLLHAGFEYREDRLFSTSDGRRSRPTRSVTLRDAVGGDDSRWTLTPALRHDQVGGFAGEWSPRLLGRLAPGRALELRASAGRSFRPPSFDDLFLPARTTAAGNPYLKPERAVDADLGVTLTAGRWSLSTTGFTSRITDLIQWEPGAAGIWRPHNVDGARIAGVEAELQGSLGPAGGRTAWVQANYTFLDPRETGQAPNTGGKVLVYRPRHRANLLLRLTSGRLTAETQWRQTGPVFITRANTQSLPGYLTADAVLRWQVSPAASVEARGLNLTDETYQDFRDFPAPGRQWRLAVSWISGD